MAARITFFAPVSLLFFFTVMVMLGVLQRRSLHPVNYFFLAAAFFAFHLLLAYLVDHLDVHASFVHRLGHQRVPGRELPAPRRRLRFALLRAGAAQVVFLVLFSYAFFFEGYTGLTVTVGAVITLFVLMQVTGRVDWDDLLGQGSGQPLASPRSRALEGPAQREPDEQRQGRREQRGGQRAQHVVHPDAAHEVLRQRRLPRSRPGRARSSRGRSRRASLPAARAGRG